MKIQRDKCFWNAGCERPEQMSTVLARGCNLSLTTKKPDQILLIVIYKTVYRNYWIPSSVKDLTIPGLE